MLILISSYVQFTGEHSLHHVMLTVNFTFFVTLIIFGDVSSRWSVATFRSARLTFFNKRFSLLNNFLSL